MALGSNLTLLRRLTCRSLALLLSVGEYCWIRLEIGTWGLLTAEDLNGSIQLGKRFELQLVCLQGIIFGKFFSGRPALTSKFLEFEHSKNLTFNIT